MLIDPERLTMVGTQLVTEDVALAASTGVEFLTDPAILGALSDPQPAFEVRHLPPLRSYASVRVDHVRLTPRLTVPVERRVIRSGHPTQIHTTQTQEGQS